MCELRNRNVKEQKSIAEGEAAWGTREECLCCFYKYKKYHFLCLLLFLQTKKYQIISPKVQHLLRAKLLGVHVREATVRVVV